MMYLINTDDVSVRRSLVGERHVRNQLEGALPRQTDFGGLFCAAPAAEYVDLIPEDQWPTLVKAIEDAGGWPKNRMVEAKVMCKDQDGTNYCWAHSLAECIEVNELCQGQAYTELAPESLGGSVNYRNAGNSLDDAIAFASQHGICRRGMVPPLSRNPNNWDSGWQQDALRHSPLEWWDIGQSSRSMWAESVSAMLRGYALYVGLDWWGHAIIFVRLVYVGNELCVEFRNSWGADYGEDGYAVLKGSKKVPSLGCFCVRSSVWTPLEKKLVGMPQLWTPT